MSELQEGLVSLARARKVSVVLKTNRDRARGVYQATVEYNVWTGLDALYADARAATSATESQVREMAIEAFNGEDRFPAEGVEIKQYNVTGRHEDGAVLQNWAWEHLPSAFVLDMKKFDAAVRAGLVPDNIAQVIKEPRASIKRDLGFLLEATDE